VTDRPQLTPLEMARNLAEGVRSMALASVSDPLSSVINRLGSRSQESAILAGNLALVSIAEDLHRLVEATVSTNPTPNLGKPSLGEPTTQEGAR